MSSQDPKKKKPARQNVPADDSAQRSTRRWLWSTCALFYFLSQVLFLVNIQFPRGYDFDEFHYVPSAKQFLTLKENQNWEHPPLGKELMAVGIGLWGDRPIGWRFMSTVFGALTLLGMLFWSLALFGDRRISVWITCLTLCNSLLYVQARIGMLDTFMFGFLVWGLAAFTAAWKVGIEPAKARKLLLFAGAMFGLATASKWAAIVPWAVCVGLVCLILLLQTWNTRFGEPKADDWYHPDLWKGLTLKDWVLSFIIVPLAAYFVTFLPFFFIRGSNGQLIASSLWDLIGMQKKMWEGQLRVVSSHPYMSQWTDWPLIKRPIWYAFDKEGMHQEYARAVALIGNPLIMWAGLPAVAVCAWGWFTTKARDAFLIMIFYSAFYFCWMVIPRKISFYYYYYPAGMVLSLALGYVFYHGEKGLETRFKWIRWAFLGVSFGIFVYFFPILSAIRISGEEFRKWMWFSTWI